MKSQKLKNEFESMECEALKNMTAKDIQEINGNIEEGKEEVKRLTKKKNISLMVIVLLALISGYSFGIGEALIGVSAVVFSGLLFVFDFAKVRKKLNTEAFIVGMLIQDKETYFNM